MNARLTLPVAMLLTVPPLMWSGNAVVGRMVSDLVPPMTLNFLRWFLAFLFLLPFCGRLLRPTSPLWPVWRRFLLLGLLGVGAFNALQYLALRTSSPINVTLVAASSPIWVLLIGRLFFAAPISRRQLLGALLSICGVLLVLGRGRPEFLLTVRLVPGDLYILLASISWSWYSWLLTQPGREPTEIRSDWISFLMAQIVFGLGWSALFMAGEWSLTDAHIVWGWPLAATLIFVSLGPAILAYRCWGSGVRQAGPTVASFFANLTPLFAATLSSLLLGELPQPYHGLAFGLIVGGIVISSRR
ncbi:MAG: DMT family transporter [Hylemonella sp.]|jgi:drug/metabolite transporter (DMT)-like permease